MRIKPEFIETLMQEALKEARAAYSLGEVPVGAVVAYKNEIIAKGHNLVEKQSSVIKHAELIAIEKAEEVLQNWRLNDCILCVTIEPCTMCTGAIKLARIGTVVFGAQDPSMGAFGSIYDLSQNSNFGSTPRVIAGVAESTCASLMSDFFREKRK